MAAVAVACTPEEPPARNVRGSGYFSVGLTDAPLDGVEEVWVTIEAFDVRSCESDLWTLLPLVQATPYELLSYQESIADLVPLISLPPGDICELRMVIGEGNYVVTDGGDEAQLKVPSSTVKLKGQFKIDEAVHTQLVVDFDASKSVHSAGPGEYTLRPVIKIEDVIYEPADGPPLPAHELQDSTNFEVHPWTDESFDIGGGAAISFSPGAVEASTVFTVSRWSRPSESSIGDIYRFSPSYTFGVAPIIVLPAAQGQDHVAVFLDNHPRPSVCAQGQCNATIPHFSDAELCLEFDDVGPLEWYSQNVRKAACVGLIKGHQIGGKLEFKPSEPMARAELLQVVARLAVQESMIPAFDGVMPFDDVDEGEWYYGLVGWAEDVGLVTVNEGDPSFRPHEPVNRAEAAALFVRASEVFASTGADSAAAQSFSTLHTLVSEAETNDEFDDVIDEAVWYYGYVYAMRDAGLMRGYGGSQSFGPGELLLRAEAATIACRAAGHCTEESSLPHAPFAAPGIEHPPQCFSGVTSHSGALKYGVDYSVPTGSDVLAVLPGTVEFVHDGCQNTPINCIGASEAQQQANGCNCFHGIGNVVVVRHEEEVYSLYAHLNSGQIAVAEGDAVCQGMILAESGDSGYGSGPHVHFQFQDTPGGEQLLVNGYNSIPFAGWYAPEGGIQDACGDHQSYSEPLDTCE